MIARIAFRPHGLDLALDQRLEGPQNRRIIRARLKQMQCLYACLDGRQRVWHAGLAQAVATDQPAWQAHTWQSLQYRIDGHNLARLAPRTVDQYKTARALVPRACRRQHRSILAWKKQLGAPGWISNLRVGTGVERQVFCYHDLRSGKPRDEEPAGIQGVPLFLRMLDYQNTGGRLQGRDQGAQAMPRRAQA